jgi:seryl-tRNA synthetase
MLDITLPPQRPRRGHCAPAETRKKPQAVPQRGGIHQALEAERKTIQTRTEELQAKRNSLSKQIGMLKAKGPAGNPKWTP